MVGGEGVTSCLTEKVWWRGGGLVALKWICTRRASLSIYLSIFPSLSLSLYSLYFKIFFKREKVSPKVPNARKSQMLNDKHGVWTVKKFTVKINIRYISSNTAPTIGPFFVLAPFEWNLSQPFHALQFVTVKDIIFSVDILV